MGCGTLLYQGGIESPLLDQIVCVPQHTAIQPDVTLPSLLFSLEGGGEWREGVGKEKRKVLFEQYQGPKCPIQTPRAKEPRPKRPYVWDMILIMIV